MTSSNELPDSHHENSPHEDETTSEYSTTKLNQIQSTDLIHSQNTEEHIESAEEIKSRLTQLLADGIFTPDQPQSELSEHENSKLNAGELKVQQHVSPDIRVYLPEHEHWDVKLKHDWDKTCCFAKNPGEDYFHTLMCGEIYLARNDECYCLRCALRLGIITQDRLYWQHYVREMPKPLE